MVNLDTRTVADLYAENYRSNYAINGSAWESNPLWIGDADSCGPIAEAASVVVEDLRAGQ
jgi:hypothetical protein